MQQASHQIRNSAVETSDFVTPMINSLFRSARPAAFESVTQRPYCNRSGGGIQQEHVRTSFPAGPGSTAAPPRSSANRIGVSHLWHLTPRYHLVSTLDPLRITHKISVSSLLAEMKQ